MATTTQLAPRGVIELLQENQKKVRARLPEGIDATKFLYGISTAVDKNPALLRCKPESVLAAAYEAAEVGCDLSPSLALGWLIPYGADCQFQPSYRFFVQRAYQTGDVAAFFAEIVYASDKFERQYAPKRNLFHAPGDGPRTLERAIGAYALIEFRDGTIDWEWCDRDLIERHRKHSKQPDSMMWTKFGEEGWRKTAIRLLAKRIPLKSRGLEDLVRAVNKDSEAELDIPAAGAVEVEKDAPVLAMPSIVSYTVGEEWTEVNGNVVKIAGALSRMGGRPVGKGWQIPVSFTDDLVALCESQKIPLTEIQVEAERPTVATAAPEPSAEPQAAPVAQPEAAEAPKSAPKAKSEPPAKAPQRISKSQEEALYNAAGSGGANSFAEQRAYILKTIARYGFKSILDVTVDKLEAIKNELEQGGFPEDAAR